jgi:hypothetical protein
VTSTTATASHLNLPTPGSGRTSKRRDPARSPRSTRGSFLRSGSHGLALAGTLEACPRTNLITIPGTCYFLPDEEPLFDRRRWPTFRPALTPVKVGPSACASPTADAAPLTAASSDADWQRGPGWTSSGRTPTHSPKRPERQRHTAAEGSQRSRQRHGADVPGHRRRQLAGCPASADPDRRAGPASSAPAARLAGGTSRTRPDRAFARPGTHDPTGHRSNRSSPVDRTPPLGHVGDTVRDRIRWRPTECARLQPLLDAAGGVRTHDLRIKSPLLYQLSYSGGLHMIAYWRR